MSEADEKPTPPVPPSDSFPIDDSDFASGEETVETSTCFCACGGAYDRIRVDTGREIVDVWDEDSFDGDVYRLRSTRREYRIVERCDSCGTEVSIR